MLRNVVTSQRSSSSCRETVKTPKTVAYDYNSERSLSCKYRAYWSDHPFGAVADPERADLTEKPRLLSTSFSSQQTTRYKTRGRRLPRICILVLFAAFVVVAQAVGLILVGLTVKQTSVVVYQHAVVATDAPDCSKVGVEILKKNGSAVDAAIASLLCAGVVNFHSTGIGGGGFMVYYNATSGRATVIDYRETAPLKGNTYMYKNAPPDATLRGGLAVAVPGEVRGLEYAWRKYGSLPWEDLFQPAAKIARNGVRISKAVAKCINTEAKYILFGEYPGLQELLAPNDKLLKEGDFITRTKYAETLEAIGRHGADYLYNSDFTEQMVEELQEYKSIITLEDFHRYSAIEREAVVSHYGDLEVMGAPPPASGAVLALILNILKGYNFNRESSLAYHRIVEAFKFAYGQRLRLGDPAFNAAVMNEIIPFMLNESTADEMRSRITDNTTHDPDYYIYPLVYSPPSPHGTSHLCVLAENGDAVAATSTVNNYFGSLIRSTTSGIIFNDEMDDFSIPGRNMNLDAFPSTVPNYIKPGKRPQSSITPTIVLDGAKVKMVVGASGGSKITTAITQVILDVLNFGKPLSESISYPRLHHQLFPNHVLIEKDFPEQLKQELEERHHEIVVSSSYAVVQGIYVNDKGIHATSDPRKGGTSDGY